MISIRYIQGWTATTLLIDYFVMYAGSTSVYDSIRPYVHPIPVVSESSEFFYYSTIEASYDGTDLGDFRAGFHCATVTTPAGFYSSVMSSAKDRGVQTTQLKRWAMCVGYPQRCSYEFPPSMDFLDSTVSRPVQVCVEPEDPTGKFEYVIHILVYVPTTGINLDAQIDTKSTQFTVQAPGRTQVSGFTFTAWVTYEHGATEIPLSLKICDVNVSDDICIQKSETGSASVSVVTEKVDVTYEARLILSRTVTLRPLSGPSRLHLRIEHPPRK